MEQVFARNGKNPGPDKIAFSTLENLARDAKAKGPAEQAWYRQKLLGPWSTYDMIPAVGGGGVAATIILLLVLSQ